MNCVNCGALLDDSTKFCAICGTEQTPLTPSRDAPGGVQPIQWEYCEVIYREGLSAREFIAQVLSPKGTWRLYKADCGQTAEKVHRTTGSMIDKMADRLVSEGWEPLLFGCQWYSWRFRRPFDPNAIPPTEAKKL